MEGCNIFQMGGDLPRDVTSLLYHYYIKNLQIIKYSVNDAKPLFTYPEPINFPITIEMYVVSYNRARHEAGLLG